MGDDTFSPLFQATATLNETSWGSDFYDFDDALSQRAPPPAATATIYCNCNPSGSFVPYRCDAQTHQCHCKPNFYGLKCYENQLPYFVFAAIVCVSVILVFSLYQAFSHVFCRRRRKTSHGSTATAMNAIATRSSEVVAAYSANNNDFIYHLPPTPTTTPTTTHRNSITQKFQSKTLSDSDDDNDEDVESSKAMREKWLVKVSRFKTQK